MAAARAPEAGTEPWQHAAKFGTSKRAGGINITPFVDVLLVVLVIFILTSNASIPGIKVDLPKASASVALEKPKTKAITIDNAGQVFLDAYPRHAGRAGGAPAHREGADAGLPGDRARRLVACSTPRWSRCSTCCAASS